MPARSAGPTGGLALRTLRPALVALLSLLALTTLGLPAHASGGSHTVSAYNYDWTPTPLNVMPGDTVTFVIGMGDHSFVSDWNSTRCSLPCTLPFPDEGTFPYHCGVHGTIMSGKITVGVPPTVTVSSPAEGASVSGKVTVTGHAQHPTHDVTAVDVLAAGQDVAATLAQPNSTSTDWAATLDTSNLPDGALTITAQATITTGVTGDATVNVTVANPSFVDLAVTDLVTTGSTTGDPQLFYTLHNQGNAPSGAFDVRLQYEYKGAWRTFLDAQHASLAAFTSSGEAATWNDGIVHVGKYPVRVLANPDRAVAESDYSNNEADGSADWRTDAVPGLDPLDP
jgi:plastocyanin